MHTQFARALQQLDIESIQAHTPQAKGRVERANATLQDRLVKELRLAGINDMEQANVFLEGYRGRFNQRFAVQPQSVEDAHRAVGQDAAQLERILALQFERTISQNLEVHYDRRIFQIQAPGRVRRLRGSKVLICEQQDGSLLFLSKGQPLQTVLLPAQASRATKSPDRRTLKPRPCAKPPASHPWRRYSVNPHQPPRTP